MNRVAEFTERLCEVVSVVIVCAGIGLLFATAIIAAEVGLVRF